MPTQKKTAKLHDSAKFPMNVFNILFFVKKAIFQYHCKLKECNAYSMWKTFLWWSGWYRRIPAMHQLMANILFRFDFNTTIVRYSKHTHPIYS